LSDDWVYIVLRIIGYYMMTMGIVSRDEMFFM